MGIKAIGHYVTTRFSSSTTSHVSYKELSKLREQIERLQDDVIRIEYQSNQTVPEELTRVIKKSVTIGNTIKDYITKINNDTTSVTSILKKDEIAQQNKKYALTHDLLIQKSFAIHKVTSPQHEIRVGNVILHQTTEEVFV
ncbi:hypothetical protein [Enterobacter ludwigii]|jgi:hypothetical protein